MIGNSLKMLAGCSGTELARLIAEGDVSARETVEAHIARITQVNPSLNAMVVERFAAAREEADLADRQRQRGASLGLLHGVPITIKECLDLAGLLRPLAFPLGFTTMPAQTTAMLRACVLRERLSLEKPTLPNI